MKKKIVAALFLTYAVLYLMRFAFGFTDAGESSIEKTEGLHRSISNLSSISYEKSITNNLRQIGSGADQFLLEKNVSLVEAYAKEATIRSRSESYSEDRSHILSIVKEGKAKIRIEEEEGLKPHRVAKYVLRVPDENFDEVVVELRKVGAEAYFEISKEDKSEEFRSLMAKRMSLDTYQKSLKDLRDQAGDVAEHILLEEKIKGVEDELQMLGVRVGSFTIEEPYSNISFSLVEKAMAEKPSVENQLFLHLFEAFVWTSKVYAIMIFVLGLVGGTLQSALVLIKRS